MLNPPLGIAGEWYRFGSPDGSQILYVDNPGIYRYDWVNGTSTLLTTEVNNSTVSIGEFSPDGRWFVFMSRSSELYLYDLQGLPEAPTPTPMSTQPTPTPTLTLTVLATLHIRSDFQAKSSLRCPAIDMM
ncbi:MAG: PD40 domain-containing protein [Anaerolinea sp.]|nr:PD40 domain-containing protein [Anaerolinea sp.]